MESDPYLDPATGVLRNRLGARTQDELVTREADFTLVRQMQLASRGITGGFDLDHLKAIHRALFQDVYHWAGEIRSVRITKGGTLRGQPVTTTFAMPLMIEGAFAQTVGKQIQSMLVEQLAEPPDFAAFAANLLGDLNHLHPFREGNGRTQREYLRQFGLLCSFHLQWGRVTGDEMIEATIQSSHEDNAALAGVILKAINLDPDSTRPPRRVR